MDLSDTEMNVEKEMFVQVSTQISEQEEEEAAKSFEKIIFENFAEDKSEDWLTHGSEATPDKEVEQDIFGEPDQDNVEARGQKGARPTSSSYSDSEPESPRSPSPKVSPVSPRVSQPDLQRESSSAYGESGESDGSSREEEEEKGVSHNDIMKETEQELLDEMIVKDVPESESSSDPVKKFEETQLTSAGIESIPEDSDSE